MSPHQSKRSLGTGDGPPPKKSICTKTTTAITGEDAKDPGPGPSTVNHPKPKAYVTDLKVSGTGAALHCRLTAKSGIRSWGPEGQSNKLFTFAMADKTGKVTDAAFNSLAETFHKLMQMGKCYRVSLYQTRTPRYAGAATKCEIHITKVIIFLHYDSLSLSTSLHYFG